jgi:hypothetical protein
VSVNKSSRREKRFLYPELHTELSGRKTKWQYPKNETCLIIKKECDSHKMHMYKL